MRRPVVHALAAALVVLGAATPVAVAETVSADVDGDGTADAIAAQASGSAGMRISVTLSASGGAVSAQRFADAFTFEPWIERVREVDGRPGAELFVHTGHISTFDTVTVLSVVDAKLVRAGRFIVNASLLDGYAMGFRCTAVRGRPGIVAYDFGRGSTSGPWLRRVRAYGWSDGRLARVGRTRNGTVRHPARSERRIGC